MRCYQTISAWTTGILLLALLWGCQNSDSLAESRRPANDARLTGSWRQIRLDEDDVSDRNIKLIITARTLTMEAPGCRISGEYNTAGELINFRFTAAEGEQCAEGQTSGKTDSARYGLNGSRLTLIHDSGGMKIKTVFERADGKQHS